MPPKDAAKRKAPGPGPPAKRARVKMEPGGAAASGGAVKKGKSHAHQVVAALKVNPLGLAQDALASNCSLTKSELAAVLNQLAQKRRIQMAKGPDGDILFMLASEKEVENANKLDELSTNELHVYQTIQDKDRDGIWKRDIKHRTGLVEKEVGKILQRLEKKRLIKMEKTVLRQNGKMFFLYDVEPSAEHTGGVWYSRPNPQDPPEFDTVGVRHIADACHKFVQDVGAVRQNYYSKQGAPMRNPSLEDIHGWVSEHSLYKETLARENIREIMQILSFDGMVEKMERANGRIEYAALDLGPDYNFTLEPCMFCGKLSSRGTAFKHTCDAPRGPDGELLIAPQISA